MGKIDRLEQRHILVRRVAWPGYFTWNHHRKSSSDDAHTEGPRQMRCTVANLSPTNDAHCLSAQFDKAAGRAGPVMRPLGAFLSPHQGRNLASQCEEHGKEMLAHGHCVYACGSA